MAISEVQLWAGDEVFVASPSTLRVVVRALVDLHKNQARRIEEAVQAGNLPHADQRAKTQRIVGQLLSFFREAAGVPTPADYVSLRKFPSEKAGAT